MTRPVILIRGTYLAFGHIISTHAGYRALMALAPDDSVRVWRFLIVKDELYPQQVGSVTTITYESLIDHVRNGRLETLEAL